MAYLLAFPGQPSQVHHTCKRIRVVPVQQRGGQRPQLLYSIWVQWSLQGLGIPKKWEINVDLNAVVCREFFGQGWMKLEKNERTPYIMKNTKHFNDVSAATVGDGETGKVEAVQPTCPWH